MEPHRDISVFVVLATEVGGPETGKSVTSCGDGWLGKQAEPKYHVLAGCFPGRWKECRVT